MNPHDSIPIYPNCDRSLITVWGFPDTPLPSQYGLVNYGQWCAKECERIRRNQGEAVVKEQAGMVCVAKG